MKKRTQKIVFAAILLTLCLSPSAAADDGYIEKISGWLSGIKTRFSSLWGAKEQQPVEQPKQVAVQQPSQQHQQPQQQLPAKTVSPQQAPAKDLNTTIANTARATEPAVSKPESGFFSRLESAFASLFTSSKDPAVAAAGNVTEETVSFTKAQSLPDAQVQFQPALELSSKSWRMPVSSVPDFTPKPRKQVAALEAQTPVVSVKPRVKSQIDKVELAEIAPVTETKVKLQPLAANPFERIDSVPEDTIELIRGLFAWLLDRKDEALTKTHALAIGTKSNVIREKATAFTGWILQDTGHPGYAAMSFWRALGAYGSKPDFHYANSIVSSLSRLSRETNLAKTQAKGPVIDQLLKSGSLDAESRSFLLLLQAERAYDHKSYAQARKLAKEMPQHSPWKEQGRYLAAVSAMAGKEEGAGYQTAGRELTELFRTVESPEVFDATAVTLGRIHFILGNYKAANQYLSQVTRETNLYIEATVDNAWALLRTGDRNHAVGNMFTLHTPHFDGAYMPESYFLKSLGYQEICQFGDALNGVKQYKAKYNDAFRRLIDFNRGGKASEMAYYDDLVDYLSKREAKLSGITLREMGRHPEFIKRQKNINRIARDEAQLVRAFPIVGMNVAAWLKEESDQLRASHKKEIARFLKTRALEMEEELKFLTANISLLEYEIFAGAGQNLSLQGAQNFAVDEKKAVPKREFEEGKEYWPFEEEIWEDELNNFRSKIVDNCAKVKKAS